MAIDKAIDSSRLNADLKAVADALRSKGGTSDALEFPGGFVDAVGAIQAGGGGASEADIENYIKIIEGNELSAVTHLTFPDSLRAITAYMCYANTALKTVTLPKNLTRIGTSAFQGSGLTEIEFPESLTSLQPNVFMNNRSMKLTELPDGLNWIGNSCFSNCESITIKRLPKSLTMLGSSVFKNCKALAEITFQSKPTFNNSTPFSGCTNITVINVPWAENEVANAPWGATNATINYNYTGG